MNTKLCDVILPSMEVKLVIENLDLIKNFEDDLKESILNAEITSDQAQNHSEQFYLYLENKERLEETMPGKYVMYTNGAEVVRDTLMEIYEELHKFKSAGSIAYIAALAPAEL